MFNYCFCLIVKLLPHGVQRGAERYGYLFVGLRFDVVIAVFKYAVVVRFELGKKFGKICLRCAFRRAPKKILNIIITHKCHTVKTKR